MKSFHARAALMSLVVLAAAGSSVADDGHCIYNSDCTPPLFCNSNAGYYCSEQCREDRDCAIGVSTYQCRSEVWTRDGYFLKRFPYGTHVFSAETVGVTAGNSVHGVCIDRLTGHSKLNDWDRYHDRDPINQRCDTNSDCAEPLICGTEGRTSHECRIQCREDRDCHGGVGYVCRRERWSTYRGGGARPVFLALLAPGAPYREYDADGSGYATWGICYSLDTGRPEFPATRRPASVHIGPGFKPTSPARPVLGGTAPPTGSIAERAGLEIGYDRPGSDIRIERVARDDASECAAICERTAGCVAWSLHHPGQRSNFPLCYVKKTRPAKVPDACCTSGIR
jgi:hypothetical protein